jgi:hypothetical protein
MTNYTPPIDDLGMNEDIDSSFDCRRCGMKDIDDSDDLGYTRHCFGNSPEYYFEIKE